MQRLKLRPYAPEGKPSPICPICGRRPKQKGGDYCHACAKAAAKPKEAAWWAKAVRFAVWQGCGVAFMPNGDGALAAKALPLSAIKRLPKERTLNLDGYLEGFDRKRIKKLKAAIKAANGL